MKDALPSVLVPGLNCSARLYAEQIPALWRFGPVTVADHTRDNSIMAIANRILAAAPPRFALLGLSMVGYIAMEIIRRAPARVAKLEGQITAADLAGTYAVNGIQMEMTGGGNSTRIIRWFFPARFSRRVPLMWSRDSVTTSLIRKPANRMSNTMARARRRS